MTAAARSFFLIAGLALAGCHRGPLAQAERTLRSVGAPELRRQAAPLYKDLFATSGGRYFLPRLEQCPPAFQKFKPLKVRAYADGFSLTLREGRGFEEGLYVVPLGMDNVPRESRHAEFRKIDDGIFWYQFTD